MSDYFKRPPKATGEKPAEKKIEFGAVADAPPIEVSPEKERAAIAAGEILGYVTRDPEPQKVEKAAAGEPTPKSQPPAPVVTKAAPTTGHTEPPAAPKAAVKRQRGRGAAEMRSLYVQGPASVLDRFIAYTNETSPSYWQAIDQLLRGKGR